MRRRGTYRSLSSFAELAGIVATNRTERRNTSQEGQRLNEIPSSVGSLTETASRVAGPLQQSAPVKPPRTDGSEIANVVQPATFCDVDPKYSGNVVNDLFARLLYGDRLEDSRIQRDSLRKFRPIVRSAAYRIGYLKLLKHKRALCDGDWESTGNFCLTQELVKYRTVSLYELDRLWKANRFAYIWKALCADFKDEMRKILRRPEVFLGDTPDERGKIRDENRQIEAVSPDSCLLESKVEQFQRAAKSLPTGPATIAESIAELCRNPKQLLELTDPELSDRACKTLVVEHMAKSRGVKAQAVRKNMRQFKEHSDDREYASIRGILRRTIEPVSGPPRITAPAAVVRQHCPVFNADTWAVDNAELVSKPWSPKCIICDARLHNEGDFCAVCVPEDEERKFQRFSPTSKSHSVVSPDVDVVTEGVFGGAL
jgi:hypothetical protein